MGPDEKDTGVIVIYEEPDGPLLGTVDGEIPKSSATRSAFKPNCFRRAFIR